MDMAEEAARIARAAGCEAAERAAAYWADNSPVQVALPTIIISREV